jgi:hypothetical protein
MAYYLIGTGHFRAVVSDVDCANQSIREAFLTIFCAILVIEHCLNGVQYWQVCKIPRANNEKGNFNA